MMVEDGRGGEPRLKIRVSAVRFCPWPFTPQRLTTTAMQNRRDFLRAALATSVGPFLCRHAAMSEQARGPTEQGGGFQTVGLYASLPTDPPPKDPRVYDFFQACG